MPTFERALSFRVDYRTLSDEQRAIFKSAVRRFVEDLRLGSIRPGLRVKRVRKRPGVWEMTWVDDGRATFSYGRSIRDGEPHVIWRRVGTHDIFDNP